MTEQEMMEDHKIIIKALELLAREGLITREEEMKAQAYIREEKYLC